MLSSDIPAPTQRVCIIGDGSLFHEGVAQLLALRTNLLVSRAIYSGDPAFLNIIASHPLDVILICESPSLNTKHMLNLISSLPAVTGLRIIILRLGISAMEVYARALFVDGKLSSRPRRIKLKTTNDLISALRRKRNGLTNASALIPQEQFKQARIDGAHKLLSRQSIVSGWNVFPVVLQEHPF